MYQAEKKVTTCHFMCYTKNNYTNLHKYGEKKQKTLYPTTLQFLPHKTIKIGLPSAILLE